MSSQQYSNVTPPPFGGDVYVPPNGGGAFRALKLLVRGIDAATFWCIVVTMAMMSIILSLLVVLRYGFNSSLDSADELSRLFFVWSIFLAIPHGVKHGVHVGIDLFVKMMPGAIQELLFRVMAGLGTFLMIIVMIGGWVATVDRWPELMPTLQISSGIYFIAVMFSGVHSFLHLALLAWGGSRTWEGALT